MICGSFRLKGSKRSVNDEEDCCESVSEEIKRCRISATPGELRFVCLSACALSVNASAEKIFFFTVPALLK